MISKLRISSDKIGCKVLTPQFGFTAETKGQSNGFFIADRNIRCRLQGCFIVLEEIVGPKIDHDRRRSCWGLSLLCFIDYILKTAPERNTLQWSHLNSLGR